MHFSLNNHKIKHFTEFILFISCLKKQKTKILANVKKKSHFKSFASILECLILHLRTFCRIKITFIKE